MKEFSLPGFAIRRPVTVMMLLVTVVGLGFIAVRRTPIEFMPPMDLPFLGVYIPFPNATPAQVEQEIAIPAEGEFRTLRGLRELNTNSDSDGCWIMLNFDWGTHMPTAQAEVRDRMERLRLVLPEDADRIMVRNFSLDTIPIIAVGVTHPGDPDVFADMVDEVLAPRLTRIDGVAEVDVMGFMPKQIMIDIDQQALMSYNISLGELIQTLNVANVDVGVGEINQGNTRYHVRAEAKIQSVPEYAALQLSDGVRVGDVVKGGYRSDDPDFRFAIDGEQQIFMSISKEAGSNAAATCDAVIAELKAAALDPKLEGMEHFIYFSQGDVINSALSGLERAAIYGGIMALIVLFIFLQRIRPTIVVALAIPGSLMIAFVVMFAFGMSLNLLTMMSMILAVGMVVDNSIVVIENIYRYQEMGLSPRESAERGAREVSLAIVAATTTTGVVFAPVFYMDSGQMSVFTRQFSIPVTVALAGSLLLALTVIPLAVSRFKPHSSSPMARLRHRFGHAGSGVALESARTGLARFQPIGWLRGGYVAVLSAAIRHRLAALLVLAGFIAWTFMVPIKQMKFQSVAEADRRTVNVGIRFDSGYTLEKADGVFDEVESLILARKDDLGLRNIFKNYSARGGELELYLVQDKDLPPGAPFPYTSKEVKDILWDVLPERIPGARLSVSAGGGGPMGGGGGRSGVSVRMEGDDMETLDRYADQFIKVLEGMGGFTSVRKSTERANQEIQLKVDGALADYAGLEPMQIAQTVGFAMMGAPLSEVTRGGREIQVRARFQAEDRKNISNLDNVMLRGTTGAMLSLEQLVEKTRGETPQRIQRFNGKNNLYVTATTAGEDMRNARIMMERAVESFELPLGYRIAFGDELRDLQEDQANFIAQLILAIVLIYVVMAALFESYLLPLSIMTSVPLAFLGVVWTMHLTGVGMDTIAFIGCILMVGVVVNNGIVIIDHINHLRRQGLDRYEAIVQGGRDRVRPVLMTAITTILGAAPLVAPLFFPRFGDPSTITLGCAMIGGLTTGTFLTLLVVPLMYSFVDDAQNWLGRYFAGIAGLGARRGGSGAA